MNELYEKAKKWVLEVGELIKERMTQTVTVQIKQSHSDLVTTVDREVETFLVKKIQQHYPEHSILG